MNDMTKVEAEAIHQALKSLQTLSRNMLIDSVCRDFKA